MGVAHRLGQPVAMRILPLAAALCGLGIAGLLLATAGRNVAREQTIADEAAARQAAEESRQAEARLQAEQAARQAAITKTRTSGLERIAARPPLSELSLALPPKPKPPPDPSKWKPTRLFNPVATSAGTLEAKGYIVALKGIVPLPADENCTYQGRSWPCGAQARTAFRAWLRSRAVQCVVPPEPDREAVTAECQIGRDDPAAWLVANGWARAVAGGPYFDTGKKAEAAGKGLFGAPPKRVTVTLNAPAPAPLNLPATTPAPADQPLAPAQPPTVNEIFPPAPSAQ